MKLKNVFLKGISLACIFAAVLVSSCKEEDRLTLQDTQDITEETVTDSFFQDMDDMAGVVIQAPSNDNYSGGRAATTYQVTIEDSRFKCAGVVATVTPGENSTPRVPTGVITVDFGTVACPDINGIFRTGKLIFTYTGWRFKPGSKVVITTDNYSVEGIKLEGIRTLTNVTGSDSLAPSFNAVLENGKATFTDGSTATRVSDITWQWVRGTSVVDDYLLIDQSSTASGVTRGGRTYSASLSKALKFKRFCGGLPVEGIKKYLIDNTKDVLIDYGDGTCDRKMVVTVNGITRSLTVN